MIQEPTLAAVETPLQHPCTDDENTVAGPWEQATDAQRRRALRRLSAVEDTERFHQGGFSLTDADAKAGALHGASARSVAQWRKAVIGLPAGNRLTALLDRPGRGRREKAWDGPEADQLWSIFASDWLRDEAPNASACWNRVKAYARTKGQACPSLAAFRRRIARDIPRREIVRAREGALASMDLHPHQVRTVADLKPLEFLCGDGRRHDLIVTFPSGRQGRPCVWAWQDVWSRRILAWAAGETESADLVRTSLHEVLTNCGIPEAVQMDSTRAASAGYLAAGQRGRKRWRSSDEHLPGLLKLLEIRLSTTAVDHDGAGRGKGRGRSKPIERAFRDLGEYIDKHPRMAGAYTGRSPSDRPETHRSTPASWDDFLAVVKEAVVEHNARPGRQTEIAAGRSFNDAWTEGIERSAIRRMTGSQAGVLLLAGEDQLVQPNGTIMLRTGRASGIPNNRYHSPALVDYAGRRVVARFDPGKLHEPLKVYDLEGRYVCAAECLMPVGVRDAAAAKEFARARRRERRGAEMALEGRRDQDALRQAIDDARPEPFVEPDPAATRLVVGLPGPPPDMEPKRNRVIQALKITRKERER